MNGKTIKRILVAIGVAAGVITVTASQAGAGATLPNHSEPVLKRP